MFLIKLIAIDSNLVVSVLTSFVEPTSHTSLNKLFSADYPIAKVLEVHKSVEIEIRFQN